MKKKNRPQAKEAQALMISKACSNSNTVVSFYCDECMSKFYCSKSEHKLTVHDRKSLLQPIAKKKGGKKGEEKREKKKKKKKEEEEEGGKKKKKKIKKKEEERKKMFHCSFCKQPRYFHTQNALNHHICNKHAA